MTGKGDNRRPQQVPQKDFEKNWDKVFGKKRKRDSSRRGRKK